MDGGIPEFSAGLRRSDPAQWLNSKRERLSFFFFFFLHTQGFSFACIQWEKASGSRLLPCGVDAGLAGRRRLACGSLLSSLVLNFSSSRDS